MATNVYDILKQRGFVSQVTDENAVRDAFAAKQITAYIGFDPTSDSLHVGNLLGLMALAHLQRQGHRPIAIIGDGTAMIGDPSGKTEMRKMLSKEDIRANAEHIKAQVGKYIQLDGESGLAVHNASWLLELNYVDFLREIGRHFSVNRMLAAEAYKIRLETGLSFIEFNYQVLQAYDFLRLYQDYGCTMQLGGDDQWGNIVAGVDLVRRVESAEVEGITWPLLTTAGGEKMGKTAAGAVWLDAAKTSPYDFYQYWINVDDRDVRRFLAYYTFLPMDEIERLAKLQGADIRKAKEILAFEATQITHGQKETEQARKAAQTAFQGAGDDITAMPASAVSRERLQRGIPAVELFAETGLVSSKSEARRLIQQGGAYVNHVRIESIDSVLSDKDFDDQALILRAGKKRYHRVFVQ